MNHTVDHDVHRSKYDKYYKFIYNMTKNSDLIKNICNKWKEQDFTFRKKILEEMITNYLCGTDECVVYAKYVYKKNDMIIGTMFIINYCEYTYSCIIRTFDIDFDILHKLDIDNIVNYIDTTFQMNRI